MPPASLKRQCTATAVRNLKRIDEDGLGDTPWHLLLPIINKCDDPQVLRAWEVNTPQIRGKTGDIWLKFIKRDVPGWRTKPHEPKDPQSWYKVYRKLKAEADEEEHRAEDLLKAKMAGIRKDEATWRVAAPTKAIPEKQSRHKGVAMQFQRGSDNNGLRFTTGTKTKDFMQSVRRQAAESKLQKSGVLARPSNMLNNSAAPRSIAKAPQYMVEDRQRQAGLSRSKVERDVEPRADAAPSMSLAARSAQDLKMREERLRAVREGRVVPQHSFAPAPTKAVSEKARTPAISTNGYTGNARVKTKPSEPAKSTFRSTNIQSRKATPVSEHEDEADDLSDDSKPVSSVEQHTSAKRQDIAGSQANVRSGPQQRRTSTPPTSKKATILINRKRSPPKSHSYPHNMRPATPDLPPKSSSQPATGSKRKAGPTILLPVKRSKR
jgi:elongin-A